MHVLGADHVPAEGNPNVMVACHQNCLIDGISAFLALPDHKTHAMARSGVFRNAAVAWVLRKFGLLPISRLGFEGEAQMDRFNNDTLSRSVETLADGHTLILFPEAGHQDKRWLGYFSLMYVRLAFDVAKRCNYEREVYITPYAHHYANYHHPFYEMMLIFGEPFPISSYYEKYQERPRTCQREISAIIEQRISDMMLDIRDVDNYEAIDYLRQSEVGEEYCLRQNLNPRHLPDRLAADKQIVAELDELDEDVRHDIYNRAADVSRRIKSAGVRDWVFRVRRPAIVLALMLMAVAALAVPALAAFALTLPIFALPFVLKRIPVNGAVDRMFDSSYDYGATVALTYPMMALFPMVPLVMLTGWWGLLWPAACLIMMLFVCFYQRIWVKTAGLWRYCITNRSTTRKIKRDRENLFNTVRMHLKTS